MVNLSRWAWGKTEHELEDTWWADISEKQGREEGTLILFFSIWVHASNYLTSLHQVTYFKSYISQ